jgi:hypothetical protein
MKNWEFSAKKISLSPLLDIKDEISKNYFFKEDSQTFQVECLRGINWLD